MPRERQTGPRSLRRLFLLPGLPLLLLVVCLVVTGWLANSARDEGYIHTSNLLATRQLGNATRFEAQFSLLVASARRLAASHISSQAQFRQVASKFLSEHPTLLGVELIRKVPDSQRELVEQQMSREQNQFVQFRQWQQLVSSEPLAQQDSYLVVRWSYARSDSEETGIGSGLLATSVPNWRRDLLTALEQQSVTSTPLTKLEGQGVNAHSLRIFVPTGNDELVSIAMDPSQWLGGMFGAHQDPRIKFTVHDLSQHTKTPLYHVPAEGNILADKALRSEVATGNRHWMISTFPTEELYRQANARTIHRIWLSGLGFALIATAFLSLWLWQRQRFHQQLQLAKEQNQRLHTRQQNLEVEKTILHQALDEGGRRTRDLIGLAGGIIAELDEQGRVGFISEAVSELLQLPPSALADQALEAWISPGDQEAYRTTLAAAREEKRIERIDLGMQGADNRTIPVTLRVKTVTDPVHGCTGFRLSVLPRQ